MTHSSSFLTDFVIPQVHSVVAKSFTQFVYKFVDTFKNVKQIVMQPGGHSMLSLPTTNCRQASLEQPLVADHKTEHTQTHRHTHSLPGLPHHFLPVRVSSLLPGSGPHTEPTCFAMQCFCTGTKCQLAKSICAPLFLL